MSVQLLFSMMLIEIAKQMETSVEDLYFKSVTLGVVSSVIHFCIESKCVSCFDSANLITEKWLQLSSECNAKHFYFK